MRNGQNPNVNSATNLPTGAPDPTFRRALSRMLRIGAVNANFVAAGKWEHKSILEPVVPSEIGTQGVVQTISDRDFDSMQNSKECLGDGHILLIELQRLVKVAPGGRQVASEPAPREGSVKICQKVNAVRKSAVASLSIYTLQERCRSHPCRKVHDRGYERRNGDRRVPVFLHYTESPLSLLIFKLCGELLC